VTPGAAARLLMTVGMALSVLAFAGRAGAGSPAAGQVTALRLAGTIGQGGWYRSPVLVVVTASAAGSSVRYRIDGGAVATYMSPFLVSGDGHHQVLYQARGSNGITTRWLRLNLALDMSPPTTRASIVDGRPNAAGWYDHPVSVQLNATDLPSGVATTYWHAGGRGSFNVYRGPFRLSTPGTRVLTYYSVDRAGNVEAAHVLTLHIDRQAPATTATINGVPLRQGVYTGRAVVRLHAVDDLSGVAAIEVGVDGAPPTVYAAPIVLRTTGPHVITFAAVDVAGNVEALHRIVVPLVVAAPRVRRTSMQALRLTIGASRSSLAWDHTFRISTRVQPARRGMYVALLQLVSMRGQTWRVIRYGRFDASGRVSWVLRARRSARYRAFAGTRLVSPTVAVRVSSVVTLRRVPAALSGQVLLTGHTWPALPGHVVALQQPGSRGRWHTVATTLVQPHGLFAFIVPFNARGTYHWRVWDGPANGVASGRSNVVGLAAPRR
jgi:hypothetical protein